MSFSTGLARGNLAIVSATAALYFVVPAIVGVVYSDAPLSARNLLGGALAIVAIALAAS